MHVGMALINLNNVFHIIITNYLSHVLSVHEKLMSLQLRRGAEFRWMWR